MWKEAEPGAEINIEHAAGMEVQPRYYKCLSLFQCTMMTDGIKNAEKEGTVKVFDVAGTDRHGEWTKSSKILSPK